MWFAHGCYCVSLWVCMCVYVCAWLWGMSSPLSWESLQVSWELGCFCLWFVGGAGAKPEKLPAEKPPEAPVHSLPGPSVKVSKEGSFSCFSLVWEEAVLCASGDFYPVSPLTAHPLGLGSRDLLVGLARGEGVFRRDT